MSHDGHARLVRVAYPVQSRTQLTLFVPEAAATDVEAVRRLLDPVQASLIRAHVTLCREDELEGLGSAELEARLRAFESGALSLRFGPPESFHRHGVLLPCVEGQQEFQALRRWVLSSSVVRQHAAHITLAHPRNPRAAGNTPENAALLAQGLAVTFHTVALIRQPGSAAWEQVSEHHLPVVQVGDAYHVHRADPPSADRSCKTPGTQSEAQRGVRPTDHPY